MSAYIVPSTHIAALVRAAVRGPAPAGRAVSPDTAWHELTWYSADAHAATAGAEDHIDYFRRLEAIRRRATVDTINETCDMLMRANVASVAYRYPDDATPDLPGSRPPYWMSDDLPWQRIESRARSLSPVAVLKAIAGYEYQACERPDWTTSEAARFCDALRHAAISRLPGYDDAPWEIDDAAELQIVR